ncbi:MAG: sigma-70 family RNA polymerase sigma factor, partial [Marmoricola sp.]
MSTTDSTAVDLGDPELITRVRAGDVEAFGELFARHRDAANRLARVLAGATDGDDLVSEAFVKVLNVLLAGGGPDVAFRAYLLTAVRRLHVDRIRSVQRVSPTDDMESHDLGVPFTDTAVAAFEGGAAARAFASLPERWQMVLWHLEVENQKPAEIAPLLAMSANSVSALAYRAREGLRQAFLTMHAAENADEDCERTRDLLGGYVRAALSRRDSVQVRDHLEGCRRCTGAYLELVQVNTSLAALLGPVVLGGAAAAYAGSGVVAGGGAIGVLVAGLDRAKDFVANNLSVVGAVAAAVVAVAVAGGFAVSGGQTVHPRADAPPTTPGRTAPSSAPSPATPTTPTDAKPSSASKSPGMAENGVVSSPLSDAVTPAEAGA